MTTNSELEALANAAIETRIARVESKAAPKHIVVPKMIAHGKAMLKLKRAATPERILALLAREKELMELVKHMEPKVQPRLEAVLRAHWLASIQCDPIAKTDTANCSCSMVQLPTMPSIGEAVETWIAHILEQLALSALPQPKEPI